MNNTSAYGNVLLKSAVPAQTAAVPKRDYQNESASADFRQTLKDARDSARSQDEKIARSVANKSAVDKKAAAVDAHKQAQQTAASKKSADDSVRADKIRNRHETAASDKARNQSREANDANDRNLKSRDLKESGADQQANKCQDAASHGAGEKDAASKSTGNKLNKKADTVIEDAASAVLNVVADIAQTPIVNTALSAILAEVSLITPEGDASATELADTDSVTASSVAAPSLALSAANAAALVVEGESAEAVALINSAYTESTYTESTYAEAQVLNAAGSEALAVDAELQAKIAAQLAADVSVPQASTAVGADDVELQRLAVLGAKVPIASQAFKSPAELIARDIPDALESVGADAHNAEKPSAKITAATADTQMLSAQQTTDAKTAFEKMLHTVARSDSTGDSAIPTNSTPTSSTSTSAAGAMDSLFRVGDAQTPAARSFVVQTAVPVPVGQPQWSQAVGERVLWLAAQNVTSAEINLHPKDLGPMQVKVSINQEQASVSFTSHHAVVREVLDQNLGRLRDMFSEQGLNLVNVDVSDKSFSHQQGEGKDQKGQAGTNGVMPEEEVSAAMSAIVQQRLVDHYA